MSDAESPENTGQKPPNQRNHPDSSPHPQDAPSCRTCAPVTANAARVLGMSHPQPTGGYAKRSEERRVGKGCRERWAEHGGGTAEEREGRERGHDTEAKR